MNRIKFTVGLLVHALLTLILVLPPDFLYAKDGSNYDHPRERIEWVQFRWENVNDPNIPRILLIGDSISKGYHQLVVDELKGIAHVDNMATSKVVSDPAIFKETVYALDEYNHAIIHFNNGLHGKGIDTRTYAEALEGYVIYLRRLAPEAQLIWSNTTPVPSSQEGIKLDADRNAMVLERNKAAKKIMKTYQIPIIDLYNLMVDDLESLSASKGNVHYNEKGRRMQAKAIAERIKNHIDAR